MNIQLSSTSIETGIETAAVAKIWNVSDFAKRYRLDEQEEKRLVRLFGQAASEQELLKNASRAPLYP